MNVFEETKANVKVRETQEFVNKMALDVSMGKTTLRAALYKAIEYGMELAESILKK